MVMLVWKYPCATTYRILPHKNGNREEAAA